MNAFATAMESVPGPLSRSGVVEQLRAMTTFDAGGLFGPIQLGANLSNGCYVAVVLRGGTWRRLAPSAGFLR